MSYIKFNKINIASFACNAISLSIKLMKMMISISDELMSLKVTSLLRLGDSDIVYAF